jgi:hypothetical protein
MEHSYFVKIEKQRFGFGTYWLRFMEVVKIHTAVHFNKGTSCKLYLLELLINH